VQYDPGAAGVVNSAGRVRTDPSGRARGARVGRSASRRAQLAPALG